MLPYLNIRNKIYSSRATSSLFFNSFKTSRTNFFLVTRYLKKMLPEIPALIFIVSASASNVFFTSSTSSSSPFVFTASASAYASMENSRFRCFRFQLLLPLPHHWLLVSRPKRKLSEGPEGLGRPERT